MRRNNVAIRTFYLDLGRMLRGFRLADGTTSAALAGRIGITPRMLQRFETAESPVPTHVVIAIAAELDLSLDFDVFPITEEKRKSA